MKSFIPKYLIISYLCLTAIPQINLIAETPTDSTSESRIDFNRDIRPILSENCFYCHGVDAKHREADLRLDTFEGATRDLGGYAAVVPGDPEESELYFRLRTHDKDELMPPPDSNRKVTKKQIDLIRRWISAGAKYETHWAFQPVKAAGVSAIKNIHPIDRFVTNKLKESGRKLKPSTLELNWLRRIHLDMTGLPPDDKAQAQFKRELMQHESKAREAAVDRVLNSPHYGERMAIDWLDVARYADTHGFNNDSARSMWRWRDWVIEAFNRNMPYDQFITEQLAGDLIENSTLSQKIATGFLRNHVINSEGGIIDEEYRVEYVADRVRTLGMAWLGLTLECARCHDHKYDPITQKDYFRLFAFFNNVNEVGEAGRANNVAPIIASPTKVQQFQDEKLAREISKWEVALNAKLPAVSVEDLITPPAPTQPKDVKSGYVWIPDLKRAAPQSAFATKPKTEADVIHCGKDQPLVNLKRRSFPSGGGRARSISLWFNSKKPLTGHHPLITSAAFNHKREGAGYGKGLDLRIVDGEVQFSLSNMYPGICLSIRSKRANLKADQWYHITAIYDPGAKPKVNVRAYARDMRLYLDGQEIATVTLHDDTHDRSASAMSQYDWRLGREYRNENPAQFTGQLDEILISPKILSLKQIINLFAHRAIPLMQANQGKTAWRPRLIANHMEALRSELLALETERSKRFKLQRDYPTTMIMQELSGEPRKTHVLKRGIYNAPGELVEAGVPEKLLGDWPKDAPKNRLGLAMWLTKRDHPLTARVVMNRVWQHLFGQGLVKTSEDFGYQAAWPSHPKLLDYLAHEFINSGWDLKAMYRMILLSSTYGQQSEASPQDYQWDPENKWLARGPRVRLPAEVIRDQALKVSGLMQTRLGGPSVFPYQPEGIYKGVVVGAPYTSTTWVQSKGADLYRRSLYTFWKRTVPHPAMLSFDAPDREFSCVRRASTNTPLQALNLMNDPIYLEAAAALARQSVKVSENANERLGWLFRQIVGRDIKPKELAALNETLKLLRKQTASQPKTDEEVSDEEQSKVTALDMIASLLLNLDETITKH